MSKQYRIIVFGKAGCPKCTMLNKRIDTLLEKDEWSDFEKKYESLDTEDGLVAFCRAECVNPGRVPAFAIAKNDPEAQEFKLLPNPNPQEEDPVLGDSSLYAYLGVQTDYAGKGRGVIRPAMLTRVLEQARSL